MKGTCWGNSDESAVLNDEIPTAALLKCKCKSFNNETIM